jgi:cytochrome P450
LLVVPSEIGPYVSFTLPAILAALAHWALEKLPPGKALTKLSPVTKPRGFSDPWLWSSPRRWVRRRRILFPTVEVQDRPTLRETAAALVVALVSRLARAPPVPQVSDAWEAALIS